MKRLCFFILTCSFLGSCDNETTELVQSGEFNPWIYTEDFKASFQSRGQSSKAYRADIHIDHSSDYSYENLYVKYSIISDRDTIKSGVKSFMLQNEFGQWIGKHRNKSRYRSVHVLAENIEASFIDLEIVISQYSRLDTLIGIEQITIGLIPIQ